MIYEVTAFCLMLASRPVNPGTHETSFDDECYFDTHKASPTLRDVLQLPQFKTQKWRDVVDAVAKAEDLFSSRNIDSLIPKPVQNCLDMMQNEFSASLNSVRTEVVTTRLAIESMVGSQSRQILEIRQALALQGLVPEPAQLPSSNESSWHLTQHTNPPPGCIVPVVQKQKTGNRKKRPGITQEEVQQAEVRFDQNQYRPILGNGRDNDANSFDDWWEIWKWIQKTDIQCGGTQWRCDGKIAVTDPVTGETTVQANHNNTQWLSKRRLIWEVPQHYIDAKHYTEEEALEVGRELYNQAKGTSSKKPSLKNLKEVFTVRAKELGIHSRG